MSRKSIEVNIKAVPIITLDDSSEDDEPRNSINRGPVTVNINADGGPLVINIINQSGGQSRRPTALNPDQFYSNRSTSSGSQKKPKHDDFVNLPTKSDDGRLANYSNFDVLGTRVSGKGKKPKSNVFSMYETECSSPSSSRPSRAAKLSLRSDAYVDDKPLHKMVTKFEDHVQKRKRKSSRLDKKKNQKRLKRLQENPLPVISLKKDSQAFRSLIEVVERKSKKMKLVVPKYNAHIREEVKQFGVEWPSVFDPVSEPPIQLRLRKPRRRQLDPHDRLIEEQGLRDEERKKYRKEPPPSPIPEVVYTQGENDKGEYIVSRIKDLKWYDDGSIKARVEWEEWPAEDTYESLSEVSNTARFDEFEKLLADVYQLNDETSYEKLNRFRYLVNAKLSATRDERAQITIFLLKCLNKTITQFNSEEGFNKDFSKLKEAVRRKFRHFLELDIVRDPELLIEVDDDERKKIEQKLLPSTMYALLVRHFYPMSVEDLMSSTSHVDFDQWEAVQSKLEKYREDLILAMKLAGETEDGWVGDIKIVKVRNEVDDTIPEEFGYITGYIPTSKVDYDEKHISCDDATCLCCDPSSSGGICPCAVPDHTEPNNVPDWYPYKNDGRVRLKQRVFIYECNDGCFCSSTGTCKLRVTSKPLAFPMEIFRTDDGRGWGLQTRVDIKKGEFVMRIAGELKNFSDVNVEYEKGKINNDYLMILDYDGLDQQKLVVVDASKRGNLSRFINHSCVPNLLPRIVFSSCYNAYIPRIALFANRNIKAGEELTFDYMMDRWTNREIEDFASLVDLQEDDLLTFNGDPSFRLPQLQKQIEKRYYVNRERFRCRCGTDSCRIFFN